MGFGRQVREACPQQTADIRTPVPDNTQASKPQERFSRGDRLCRNGQHPRHLEGLRGSN